MALSVRRLTENFGAEITGVDLTRPVDDAVFAAIFEAFNEYSVLVFHDQYFDDDSQVAFSRRFGPLETTVGSNTGAGSYIAVISNIDPETDTILPPDGWRMRYNSGNEMWHSDSSFKPVPAMASMLSGRETPPEGADTEFASTRAAYAALPEDRRREIAGLVAVHDFSYSRGLVDPDLLPDAHRKEVPPVRQAVVRANPANGRKAFFAGSHASHIEGRPVDEGRALLRELTEFATQPRFVYRHRWRPRDFVIWDNRCVLHRGTKWDQARHRRVMHRTTVAGDGPTA